MKHIIIWLVFVLMSFATLAFGETKEDANALQAEEPQKVEEPQEVEEAKKVGYDGGFFIRNAKNTFQFTVNGRVQPRVYFQKTNGQSGDWSFGIRRVRLDFDAMIVKKANFHIALQHSTSSANFSIMNIIGATASYSFHKSFTLTMGTVGLPLSMIGCTSSLGYHLLEPPVVLTQQDGGSISPTRSAFGNPDGLGILINGSVKKFFYEASVVNGAAATTLADAANNIEGSGGTESNYDFNFNRRVSVGARIGVNILDPVSGSQMDLPYSEKVKLTMSAGGTYQGARQDPNNAVEISRIITGSTGIGLRYRGFSITTEVFGRRMSLDNPGNTTWFSMSMDDFGYYVDTGYFVLRDKLELAVAAGQIFREGQNNDSYQFGGGINWYVVPTFLKWQLSYTATGDFDEVAGTKRDVTHFVGTQFSASF